MMRGLSWYLIAPVLCAGLLSGCRFGDNGREAWRTEAEEQCISEKGVVASAFMEPMPAIEGKGTCGMDYPFRVHAFADGNVAVEPAARMACPAIRETEGWVRDVVQPAASAWLGQPVTAIRQMSSYSCRTMNGQAGAKISEHAFGNALDIGAFRTADGRWITVKNGWKGTPEEQGFLRQVHAGACERFTTVLSPGSNIYHYDHIHFDLKRHAKGRSYCNPKPQRVAAPLAPPLAAPPASPPSVPVKAEPELLPPYSAPVYDEQPPYTPPSDPAPVTPPPADLPPGWITGPQGYPTGGPMSYAPMSSGPAGEGRHGPFETGSVRPNRKYFITPVPQPSSIPLPEAKPGED